MVKRTKLMGIFNGNTDVIELPDDAVLRLKKLAGRRLTDSGDIIIESRDHRSRLMNTNSALRKLNELIKQALVVPRKRKPTRPTRASRERRLVSKKQQSEKKTSRKKPLA